MNKFIKILNGDGIVSRYINLDFMSEFDIINDIVYMNNGQTHVITSPEEVNKIKNYILDNLIIKN